MRIVFLGFQTWGYVTLKTVLQSRHEVAFVITHPSSTHAYETIFDDSVKDLAKSYHLPVIECKNVNDESVIAKIEEVAPDLIISADWRNWISPNVFNIPKYGGINVHEALLPEYGGFGPLNWVLVNGETKTGVTIHYLNEAFDLGNIIVQKEVPILWTDTATDLFHKTIALFPELTLRALELIESNAPTKKQDINKATFYHKRSERDSLIDWNKSNTDIYNLIRAQSDPFPNAFTYFNKKKLLIKKASLPLKTYCGSPGRVFCRVENGVVIVCGTHRSNTNQGLIVELVQAEDQSPVNPNQYFKEMGHYLG